MPIQQQKSVVAPLEPATAATTKYENVAHAKNIGAYFSTGTLIASLAYLTLPTGLE
jgi:hypothetical protein